MGTRGTRPSNITLTKLPEGTVKRFQLDFDPFSELCVAVSSDGTMLFDFRSLAAKLNTQNNTARVAVVTSDPDVVCLSIGIIDSVSRKC